MSSVVRDVMTASVISVRKHAEFKDIVHVMRARQFSAFPVLDDDDRVVGVLSEDDLLIKTGYDGSEPVAGFLMRRTDRMKAAGLTAGKLMTKPAITIGPEATLAEAARTMHAKHVKRLPVVTKDRRLVGIVSRTDVLSALRGAVDNEAVGGSLLDAVRGVDGVIAVHETLSYPALERRSHRV